MKPSALWCSDTHLRSDKPDTFFAFQAIITAAVRHKVPVFGAGDLLDKQSNRAKTVVFLAEQLRRLRDAGLTFYYTQGQHELDLVPWLQVSEAAVHLHRRCVEVGGLTYYGLDWQPFGPLQDELAAVPDYATALVCHQVWADWMGDRASPQGEMAQIPGHVTHVLTGDLHQWRLDKIKNADGVAMTVVSCGATAKQKIDEPDFHHYALAYPGGKVERQDLASRVVVPTSILLTAEDVDGFVATAAARLATAEQAAAALDLPPDMAKPYLRVMYAATLPGVVKRVEKCVGDRALVHFKPLASDDQAADYALAKAAGRGPAATPLSVLGQEVDRDEAPNTYELVERLLVAAGGDTDPAVAFAQWRAAYLGE